MYGPRNVSEDHSDFSQALVCVEQKFESPPPRGRKAVDEQGSPLPIGQVRNLSLRDNNGARDGSFSPAAPRQFIAPGTVQQGTPNTSSNSSGILVPNPPPTTPARTDSAISRPRSLKDAMTPHHEGTQQGRMASGYQAFFDVVVDFAYKYVNHPSTTRDSQMPQSLKTILLNASTSHTAFGLMSSEQTRYFLVTKIMIQWIQDNLLSGKSFSGLDKEVDETIAIMQLNLGRQRPSPPPEARNAYRQEITRQYAKLRALPDYEQFVSSRNYQRAVELWNFVQPLMHRRFNGDWEHMYYLVQQGHQLAETTLSDIAEYRIFFPKVHEAFNPRKMINMDVAFRELHPNLIEAEHFQVRLGAIPEVMCQVASIEGACQPITLTKAGVLLKQPKT